MEIIGNRDVAKECLLKFEKAAAKGHKESLLVTAIWKDADRMASLQKEFSEMEEPLGWYLAGRVSRSGQKVFDFFKKSAEQGCSWGQLHYGWYFKHGPIVEADEKMFQKWVQKSADQNNPEALQCQGYFLQREFQGNFFSRPESGKALSCYRRAAELGWKSAMGSMANILSSTNHTLEAVIWSAKGTSELFWTALYYCQDTFESGTRSDFLCDFDRCCYALGWGMYWYIHGIKEHQFGNQCLDYYCACVELQQKSIFTFLLCWNQTTIGVKGPGQMIAQMVWQGREGNLLKPFSGINE
jgi:TPR repeat protein